MSISSLLSGESLTRLIQGTVLGAVAAMLIGFNWGGWTLGSTAEKQARDGAQSAVVEALAPICVANFQQDVEATANTEALKKQSSYKRTGFIEKGGWATFAGNAKANSKVAKACALLLKESV